MRPSTKPAMKPESRDALLAAIAKARGWIDDIRLGRIASFAEIAEREAQGRTAHPPARSSRLPVAPHHRGDRRWHRACGSHGHRSRQSPALFLGRAGAGDLRTQALDPAGIKATKRSTSGPNQSASLQLRRSWEPSRRRLRPPKRIKSPFGPDPRNHGTGLCENRTSLRTPKRKLENGEQRPAPETRPQRAKMPEIAGQRLRRAA